MSSGTGKKLLFLADSQKIKLRRLRSHMAAEDLPADLFTKLEDLWEGLDKYESEMRGCIPPDESLREQFVLLIDASFRLCPQEAQKLGTRGILFVMVSRAYLGCGEDFLRFSQGVLFSDLDDYLESKFFLFGISTLVRERNLLDLFQWGHIQYNWFPKENSRLSASLPSVAAHTLEEIKSPEAAVIEGENFCKFWHQLEQLGVIKLHEAHFVNDALICGVVIKAQVRPLDQWDEKVKFVSTHSVFGAPWLEYWLRSFLQCYKRNTESEENMDSQIFSEVEISEWKGSVILGSNPNSEVSCAWIFHENPLLQNSELLVYGLSGVKGLNLQGQMVNNRTKITQQNSKADTVSNTQHGVEVADKVSQLRCKRRNRIKP